MVFENLTLFEFTFEDAQFGPREIGASEETDDVEAAEGTETTGGGWRRYLPLVVGIVLLAAVATRRYRGRETEADIEIASEDADVQAAEQ